MEYRGFTLTILVKRPFAQTRVIRDLTKEQSANLKNRECGKLIIHHLDTASLESTGKDLVQVITSANIGKETKTDI